MCGGSRGPDFVRIDASNENLAVGEFHKPVEIGLDIRKCQALRQEYNRPIVACEGARQRIIVADGILPFVQDSRLLEGTPADRGASAPAKVFPLFAQHREHRAFHAASSAVAKLLRFRNEPAHRGSRADSNVSQWRYEMMQPGFSWAAIGIRERQYFKFRRQLFNSETSSVHFLAAVAGRPGNYHMSLHT